MSEHGAPVPGEPSWYLPSEHPREARGERPRGLPYADPNGMSEPRHTHAQPPVQPPVLHVDQAAAHGRGASAQLTTRSSPLTPIPDAVVVRSRLGASPVRVVCLALALLWCVVCGVALARTSLPGPDAITIIGIGLNSTAGLVGVGMAFVLALLGAPGHPDRAAVTMVGMLLVAPGLVVTIVPQAFATGFGATAGTGIALVLSGGLLLAVEHLLPERAPEM